LAGGGGGGGDGFVVVLTASGEEENGRKHTHRQDQLWELHNISLSQQRLNSFSLFAPLLCDNRAKPPVRIKTAHWPFCGL
jgi:hypothetical protein